MNLDKKLELAHEYAVANNSYSSDAWAYADAMESEYNKRKQAETEKNAKQSKILFDNLNKNESGSCQHIITSLDKTWCFDCGGKINITNSRQLEFQVDWSVAPDWADWWVLGSLTGQGIWSKTKPVCANLNGVNYWEVGAPVGEEYMSVAPSFNYQGDWKDSLRKRPK